MVFAGDAKAPHFIIVAWPKHIGKSTTISNILKEHMGNYFVTDLLHIKDFSEQLEKKHNIKIEYKPTTEVSKTLIKELNYQDTGVREINNRIQQSAIGKYKIVFIENIERMTNEAANAFLKTCEEPLPKRLIIATTANANQLLETILSRALTIKFQEIPNNELSQRMDNNNMFSDNPEVKQLVIHIAMGKPGIAQRMYNLIMQKPELEATFLTLIHNLSTGKKKFFSHDALKTIYKNWILDAFIDGRIAYCINNNMQEKWQKRLKTKKLMKANISIENILLYWLLND